MKIGILGAGAMGMLFGGYLSRRNQVYLVDIDETRVRQINENGVEIVEPDGSRSRYFPTAGTRPASEKMDLILVFVKAMYTKAALSANAGMIGTDTFVMSLQNGAGHENQLRMLVPANRIILGMTQHNSSVLDTASVHHGGGGKTCIGMAFLQDGKEKLAAGRIQEEENLAVGRIQEEENLAAGWVQEEENLAAGWIQKEENLAANRILEEIAAEFTACGFETEVTGEIKRMIWNKLFLNVSASALTGVLQVKLGYILDNGHAWRMARTLIREAVAVANQSGLGFREQEVVEQVRHVLEHSRDGCTSICADLRDGRQTEVDTISGAVVLEGRENRTPTPCHEFMVELVHALEDRRDM